MIAFIIFSFNFRFTSSDWDLGRAVAGYIKSNYFSYFQIITNLPVFGLDHNVVKLLN